MSKAIYYYITFVLLSSVIDLRNSQHSLNEMNAEMKTLLVGLLRYIAVLRGVLLFLLYMGALFHSCPSNFAVIDDCDFSQLLTIFP